MDMTTRAAAVLLAATLLLGACGSESDESTGGSSTTSTEVSTTTADEDASTTTSSPDSGSTSTTATPGSSTTAPTAPTEDTSTAVFPAPGATTHYTDPVDVARAFATDYVGFEDPMVSPYQAGDSRSGEVPVRPDPQGPVTTVFVRQLGDAWYVLGAATDSIVLSEPAALATVSAPVAVAGESTAFEATVQVQVRQDGTTAPLGEGFVMGGSMGDMGPFTGSIDIATPSASAGAVMLWTSSMENGEVWEATVVRVRF
jgi:hypothetical protein